MAFKMFMMELGATMESRPGPLRQQDSGCLYIPPRRYQVSPSTQTGEPASFMDTNKPPFSEGGSCARLLEHRSRHAVTQHSSPGEMEAPPQGSQCDMACLWSGRCGFLRNEREFPLPDILLEGDGCAGPEMASSAPLCVPSGSPAPAAPQSGRSVNFFW